jgi:3-phosphoshikimate 1-carboxyvinyltransferase
MIEINPIKGLNSQISVPGSKYAANRVLIIAALAKGISKINNVPHNDDIDAAIEVLGKFGIKVYKKSNSVKIIGSDGKFNVPDKEIHVKNSGTLMRLITGFAALAEGKTTITGSERIKQRPIKDLLASLADLGIKCNSKNNGFPPVEVIGGTLKGGKSRIKGNVSSQYISSLLLISTFAENDVEIVIENDLVSKNYVDMTLDLMEKFGVKVERNRYESFKVRAGQRYEAKEFVVPADSSSANYFLAAAAIVPGKIKVRGVGPNQKGEAKFAGVLEKMGCKINRDENNIKIRGIENLKAIEVDMSMMPDSVQTLAAVAVFAEGTTKIKNIANLKYKESDRINDTVKELKKLGINATAKDDELVIEGGNPKLSVIDPHGDHRMAMSFALIGLRNGIKIKDPECVAKSFPQFWEKLKEIGVEIR